MPLHMSKIAFGAASVESLREWLEGCAGEARTSTRYLPKRHEEMAGGSLYWIHQHAVVGRSPLLGFEQREDGRWWIRMEPRLIAVAPLPKRAHQGWRYLDPADAPKPGDNDDSGIGLLPPLLYGKLAGLALL